MLLQMGQGRCDVRCESPDNDVGGAKIETSGDVGFTDERLRRQGEGKSLMAMTIIESRVGGLGVADVVSESRVGFWFVPGRSGGVGLC